MLELDGCARLRRLGAGSRRLVRPYKLAAMQETRNTCPYCSVACGILSTAWAIARRTRGLRSSTSRAIPTTRSTAARCARRARRCSTSCTSEPRTQVPEVPRARLGRVRARLLGLRARPHRQAHEGRPRQELHRQERRRHHGQPLDQHRLPRRPRPRPTRAAYFTYKVVRSTGMLAFDNQARV